MSGTSADATAVASVRVSIQNTATSQWWNGSGWVPATTFVNATLDTPGGTETGYTYTFNPGVEGSYAVQVRGVDSLDNLGTTVGPRPFSIQPVFVDTMAPTTTVTAPLNNSTQREPRRHVGNGDGQRRRDGRAGLHQERCPASGGTGRRGEPSRS